MVTWVNGYYAQVMVPSEQSHSLEMVHQNVADLQEFWAQAQAQFGSSCDYSCNLWDHHLLVLVVTRLTVLIDCGLCTCSNLVVGRAPVAIWFWAVHL